MPVDIHRSLNRCIIEGESIRLGFSYVSGIGKATGARLETAQKEGVFAGLADLCRRTRLPRRLVEGLILAGAMDGWDIPRRQLLWELGRLAYREEELDFTFPADEVELPPLSRAEAFSLEWGVLGLSTGEHALAFYRSWLRRQDILGSQDLAAQPAGRRVRIAGQVVVHQSPPTAKGHHFLTLEDEAGLVQVIFRPSVVTQIKKLPSWQGYGLNNQTLLLVEGIVQRDGNIINVLANRIQPLIPNADPGIPANSS